MDDTEIALAAAMALLGFMAFVIIVLAMLTLLTEGLINAIVGLALGIPAILVVGLLEYAVLSDMIDSGRYG